MAVELRMSVELFLRMVEGSKGRNVREKTGRRRGRLNENARYTKKLR